MPITSEADFQHLMADVDARLAKAEISIPWRPAQALAHLGRELGQDFDYPPPEREAQPGRYEGEDLVIRMDAWFKERYGPKLSDYWGPGRVVVSLRGDLWVIRYPFILVWKGDTIVFHAGTDADHRHVATLPDATKALNVCECVEDMPPGLAVSLAEAEAGELVQCFRDGYDALTWLEQHGNISLVRHALGDHEASVLHMTVHLPSWGQARWASLQFLEKVLKAFVAARTGNHPHGHDLLLLATKAEALGLMSLDRARLAIVQCDAAVRYGETPSTKAEALSAHWAALALAGHVAKHL